MLTPRAKRIAFIAAAGVVVALAIIAAAFIVLGTTLGTTSLSSALVGRQGGLGLSAGFPAVATDQKFAVENIGIAPMPPIYQTGGQTAAEVDQKIIKNGSLGLTVDSVSDSLGKIADIAKRHGGFMQSSSSSERGDGKHEGNVVLRVPSSDFEAAMADCKGLAKVVNNESTSGQDVTEQYTDLQAQLRNAQAQETEFLVIMKKAVTVEDILKVQTELGQVRGQIESLQGRIKYLQNVTSFSTINVSLSEVPVITLPTKEFHPSVIVTQAMQALIALGQNVVTALIWLAIVGGGIAIPVLVIVLLVLAWLHRRR